MNVSKRISDICKKKKVKQIDLVTIGCGSKQTVNQVLQGKQRPNIQFIDIFLQAFPDINARWLITGIENLELCEPKERYGFCKECIKKDAIIEHLKLECSAKDSKIEELIRRSAELSGKTNQTQKKSKAS